MAWNGGVMARAAATGALVVLSVLLTGCECGADTVPDAPRPARTTAPSEATALDSEVVPRAELPVARADRTAPLVPSITVEATVRGYRITNRAVVESWPPLDRERMRAIAPPEAPDFPIVEIALPAPDDAPLLVSGIRDALGRALEAERMRSASDSTPQVFLIRAPATLAWQRVFRVLFTAAMVGLSEPAIVVRAGDTERVIRLVRPSAPSPPLAPGALGDALGAAIRDLDDEPPAAPVAAPASDSLAAPLAFVLETHGLRVRRGVVEVAAGCRTPSTDASPAIPIAGLTDDHTLDDCIAVLGEGPSSFAASADTTLGTAITVLEHLAARGPVEIVLGAD